MPTTPVTDFRAAWEQALDALELDVAEAERLLAAHRGSPADSDDTHLPLIGADWSPPAIDAPLPTDLRTRAQTILDRQLRAADDLMRTMHANRRELQLADRMQTGGPDRSVPAFLDSKF